MSASGTRVSVTRRFAVAAILALAEQPALAQAPRELRVSDVRASIVLVDLPGRAPTRTGVIFSAEGHVATASDSIVPGTAFNVRLQGDKAFPAKLVSVNAAARTAILKIDVAGLPVARIGSSAKLAKGDALVSLGYQGPPLRGAVLGTGRKEEGFAQVGLVEAALPNNDHPAYDLEGALVGFTRLYSTHDKRALVVPVEAALEGLPK
jgi:S1-C subfamily serine protease